VSEPSAVPESPDESPVAAEVTDASVSWLRGHPRLARLVEIVAELITKQSDYRLSLTAAGTSFWLVLASFPATLSAVAIYGLIASPDQVAAELKRLEEQAPASLQALMSQQVQQAAQTDTGPLTAGLLISLVLTLWSASTGAYSLLRVIRLAYGIAPQGYLVARLRGIALTLIGIITLFALGLTATVFNQALRDVARETNWVGIVGAAIAGTLLYAAVLLAVVRFAIARRTPLRSMVYGVAIATVATVLFGIFVVTIGSAVSNYQAIYGAVSTIAAALLAGYAVIYVLLLSVLFNALACPLPFSGHGEDRIESQLLGKLQSLSDHSRDSGDFSPSDHKPH
jgi:membrane protein